MTEVTSENFWKILPQIEEELKSCSFISIDCEFSGLFTQRNCLLDSPKERYMKLRSAVQDISIIQMGITLFKFDNFNDQFHSSSYSFYLMPTGIFNTNTKLTCQIESLKFLCKYNFDFNKAIYKGINYISEKNENELKKFFNQDKITIESLYFSDCIKEIHSKIDKWRLNTKEKSDMIIKISELPCKSLRYLILLEISQRFSNLQPTLTDDDAIVIKKIEMKRKEMNIEDKFFLQKKLFQDIIGFSKIIKEMRNVKKPIIAHNCILDIMTIYQQFIKPLPSNYKQFKNDIKKLFPIIYDTKFLTRELNNLINNEIPSKSLSDVYLYFKNGNVVPKILYMPKIIMNTICDKFHDAGFDSYCAAHCFINISYLFSIWDEEVKSLKYSSMPISVTRLFSSVEPMKNHINLSRGQVNAFVLDGTESKNLSHTLLCFESKFNESLDTTKVLAEMTNRFGVHDIISTNEHKGIMIVPIKRVKPIIDYFKNNKKFKIQFSEKHYLIVD
ncbi:poly A-specific ribonuclease,putative [Pediculus humanus corporis]|uniref:Poly A-specific ribonuclease,putative n=1 Tax=Pediculus humanus subsp. corporis TaxID=121224 RepID=E0VHV7_PEDHC|nr:poly A-specific ribonuclease,putative [Pediculus humanus corporis]EEB12963.1 poly A-specific ribonuclease,putative [Pediculus humanus corporis]